MSRTMFSASQFPSLNSAILHLGKSFPNFFLLSPRALGIKCQPCGFNDCIFFACAGFNVIDAICSAQQPPVVPQGAYQNVFDIAYHKRDPRRKNLREEVTVDDAARDGLPPTAGTPAKSKFLGLAGEFNRQ